jgi:hypothetical protein
MGDGLALRRFVKSNVSVMRYVRPRADHQSFAVKVKHDRDEWRERNLATLVFAFVRTVKDPTLAWDLAAETMATAALAWSAFPGGSRMAWVLEHGRRVLRDAKEAGRVSRQERTRNHVTAPKTLSFEEQRVLKDRANEPLGLDAEAAVMAEALAREAPPPPVLFEIALSPLTIRGVADARSREHDGG